MLNRRNMLIATALAPLAACGNTTQTLIADAQLISAKFTALLPILAAIPGIPTADTALITNLSADISEVAALAGTLYANIAPVSANTILQNIELNIEGALTLATTPPLSTLIAAYPPTAGLGTVLQAASVLLPGIFALFGLVAPVSAPSNGMTPTTARSILAS